MAFTFNATIQLRFGGQLFRVWVGTGWLVTSAVSAQINDLSGPKVVLKEGLKEGNIVIYAYIMTSKGRKNRCYKYIEAKTELRRFA